MRSTGCEHQQVLRKVPNITRPGRAERRRAGRALLLLLGSSVAASPALCSLLSSSSTVTHVHSKHLLLLAREGAQRDVNNSHPRKRTPETRSRCPFNSEQIITDKSNYICGRWCIEHIHTHVDVEILDATHTHTHTYRAHTHRHTVSQGNMN